MHEVSIVRRILSIAEDIACEHGGGPIQSIELQVGDMHNIIQESLDFAFMALKVDTPAADATLNF